METSFDHKLYVRLKAVHNLQRSIMYECDDTRTSLCMKSVSCCQSESVSSVGYLMFSSHSYSSSYPLSPLGMSCTVCGSGRIACRKYNNLLLLYEQEPCWVVFTGALVAVKCDKHETMRCLVGNNRLWCCGAFVTSALSTNRHVRDRVACRMRCVEREQSYCRLCEPSRFCLMYIIERLS